MANDPCQWLAAMISQHPDGPIEMQAVPDVVFTRDHGKISFTYNDRRYVISSSIGAGGFGQVNVLRDPLPNSVSLESIRWSGRDPRTNKASVEYSDRISVSGAVTETTGAVEGEVTYKVTNATLSGGDPWNKQVSFRDVALVAQDGTHVTLPNISLSNSRNNLVCKRPLHYDSLSEERKGQELMDAVEEAFMQTAVFCSSRIGPPEWLRKEGANGAPPRVRKLLRTRRDGVARPQFIVKDGTHGPLFCMSSGATSTLDSVVKRLRGDDANLETKLTTLFYRILALVYSLQCKCGLMHGDLHLQNLLYDGADTFDEGQLTMIDFGFASARLPKVEAVAGSQRHKIVTSNGRFDGLFMSMPLSQQFAPTRDVWRVVMVMCGRYPDIPESSFIFTIGVEMINSVRVNARNKVYDHLTSDEQKNKMSEPMSLAQERALFKWNGGDNLNLVNAFRNRYVRWDLVEYDCQMSQEEMDPKTEWTPTALLRRQAEYENIPEPVVT